MCNQPTSALGILYPSAERHLLFSSCLPPSLPALGCQDTTEMGDTSRKENGASSGLAPGWRLLSVFPRRRKLMAEQLVAGDFSVWILGIK